jgi:hypothetical protein
MEEVSMKMRFVFASLALIVVLAVVGCATPTPETKMVETPVEKVVTVIVQPTKAPDLSKPPTPTIDLKTIEAAWKSSSHSNDYGEGRGPNTYCARCHSPRNWDIASKPGPVPNCMACKFPFDKEVRKPPPNTNTFIEQKDWKNIGCDVCHKVENNVVDPKPVVWNQATGKYDAVATNTELCEKCHTDSLGGSKHKVEVGGPAHTSQIGLTVKRPNECTDCHDPHSQQASCTNCHTLISQRPGHDAAHTKVACDACHDASGLRLGPTADNTKWAAFKLTISPAGGPPTLTQVTSHVLQKTVDCMRCHYEDNPNKLRSLVTPTATRPATTPTVLAPGTPIATPIR